MHWLAALVDAILVLVVLEAAALCGLFVLTGRGVSPGKLLPNLASGLSLMLAVRAVLTGSHASIVLLCLGSSLVFHLLDLVLRWSRP